MAKSSRLKATRSLIETRYTLELARGSSVIASTLTRSSLMQAIGETLSAFVANHGTGDLDGFVLVLSERLIQRDRADAAEMIDNWRPAGSSQS
ncbi:hypothetical protein C2L65_43110 [Paraburkholderia terrae]|uniref:Uncharacterized protein n=1 Tax=Paraburkholderia terrae TaxID=311230 RepID=A0A2I8F4M0_9BURK|nr:hypothetical protein C2L65_43110 [Paraburkholderia terrae]